MCYHCALAMHISTDSCQHLVHRYPHTVPDHCQILFLDHTIYPVLHNSGCRDGVHFRSFHHKLYSKWGISKCGCLQFLRHICKNASSQALVARITSSLSACRVDNVYLISSPDCLTPIFTTFIFGYISFPANFSAIPLFFTVFSVKFAL